MKRISVKDIMTRKVISADQNTNLAEIIKIMGEEDIGSIIILDQDKPVGIITLRQLLQIAEKCIPSASLKAQEIMASPVITVDSDANLREASILMLQKGIKKLVVLENGKMSGFLTQTDIERVVIPFNSFFDILQNKTTPSLALREEFQEDLKHTQVDKIMTKGVRTINSSMKINEIAKIMNMTKIGSLIVTENEKPIGIVTDQDIMRRVMNFGLDPCTVTAEKAMEPIITVSPTDSLKVAVEKMINNTVKKLGVITSEGSIIGILTTTDFLVYYRSLLIGPKSLEK